MLDDVVTSVATGAAGNIIAYMMSGELDALRAQITRIFRHGSEQERATALHALQDDAIAVTQQGKTTAEVSAQWTQILASFMDVHPESTREIEKLSYLPIGTGAIVIGSQQQHGIGPVYGGNHYGDNTFQGSKLCL